MYLSRGLGTLLAWLKGYRAWREHRRLMRNLMASMWFCCPCGWSEKATGQKLADCPVCGNVLPKTYEEWAERDRMP